MKYQINNTVEDTYLIRELHVVFRLYVIFVPVHADDDAKDASAIVINKHPLEKQRRRAQTFFCFVLIFF